MFKNLDTAHICQTIEKLEQRIIERFPGSGLSHVCAELIKIAHESKRRADWIGKPQYILRVFTVILTLAIFTILIEMLVQFEVSEKEIFLRDIVQISEATLNTVVLVGAAIFAVMTIEVRIKRTRALNAFHELRSIAHVIDMHQLTKDPNYLSGNQILTEHSPQRELTQFELTRYLDYCSEMLSLTGKLAALYAQSFRDVVVLNAVNEVESLTTAISQKIWQKIMILHLLKDQDTAIRRK